MRIRSTKPEFWRSKTIAALPWDVRLVLKGLESYVDDNGVGKDDIALIAADVFPRDLSGSPRETVARLSEAISLLCDGGLIARYDVDGEALLYIDRWKELQRIDKPGRGRFPRPDGTLQYADDVDRDSYRSPRETVASPPVRLAPVTGEQRNRGTEENRHGASADAPSDRFEEFWSAYPKRGQHSNPKKPARDKFAKVVRQVDPQKLIDAAAAYAKTRDGQDPQHTAQAITWLNQERWNDQAAPTIEGDPLADWTAPPPPNEILGNRRAVAEHFRLAREAELQRRAS